MYTTFLTRTYAAKTKSLYGGTQSLVRFKNGFGASVVNHEGSYGDELAFVKFKDEDTDEFEIVYAEPFPYGVQGYIDSQEDLVDYLEQIKALPADYVTE